MEKAKMNDEISSLSEVKASVKRTNESAKELVEITTKIFLGPTAPLVDLSKALFKHGKQYFVDKQEQRLLAFNDALLNGVLFEAQKENLKKRGVKVDVYYSILNHVLSDEEDEKVEYYVKLFKFLALEDAERQYKQHLVKIFRELNKADFVLFEQLNDLYFKMRIESNQSVPVIIVTTITATGAKIYPFVEDAKSDTLKNFSLGKLISYGILMPDEQRKPSKDLFDMVGSVLRNY
jgi:hypothetical protein